MFKILMPFWQQNRKQKTSEIEMKATLILHFRVHIIHYICTSIARQIKPVKYERKIPKEYSCTEWTIRLSLCWCVVYGCMVCISAPASVPSVHEWKWENRAQHIVNAYRVPFSEYLTNKMTEMARLQHIFIGHYCWGRVLILEWVFPCISHLIFYIYKWKIMQIYLWMYKMIRCW